MNFIKQHKTQIIAAVCTAAVLVCAFLYSGTDSTTNSGKIESLPTGQTLDSSAVPTAAPTTEPSAVPTAAPATEPAAKSTAQPTLAPTAEPVPQSTAKPTAAPALTQSADMQSAPTLNEGTAANAPESAPSVSEKKELVCTLSVRCDNAVGKTSAKSAVVPTDGVIYAEREVAFNEGESVFNVLVREMKKNKIHLEFVNTPIYNSAYIEGIGNLYEFDCGELSGWMYRVNGEFPNYGCSRCMLKPGDRVEWVYTCDLGKDVGGAYSARNGMQDE